MSLYFNRSCCCKVKYINKLKVIWTNVSTSFFHQCIVALSLCAICFRCVSEMIMISRHMIFNIIYTPGTFECYQQMLNY